MSEINKPLLRKYLKALRSGKYRQGTGLLRKGEKYCCLGIACEVAGSKSVYRYNNEVHYFGDDGTRQTTMLPIDIMKKYGFQIQNPIVDISDVIDGVDPRQPLTMCNDLYEMTFDEIANCVEKTFLPEDWEKKQNLE